MKIIRNNEEIELTVEEIETAYRERERFYHKEDVKLYCERNNIDISDFDDETINTIACTAEDNLDQNDSYWESYWTSFEEAIKEVTDMMNK